MAGFNRGPFDYNFQTATPWQRPSGWLPMPETPVDTVDMLVKIEDSLDSTFASVTVEDAGNFFVDWDDGAGAQSYASGTNAVKEYIYAAAISRDADATLGYKQAMVRVSGPLISTFRLNVIPAPVSTWATFIQPYIDISLNLPSCTTLQSYAINCQCRTIERWVILACGPIADMSNMFNSNYSCQSYTFPPGFGSVATAMSYMFSSNYSCQSYIFPAGFGAVCTTMSNMFNSNYSCQSYTFPPGFGAVCTSMSSMFSSNYSCQSYIFPADFGAVCTAMSYMFNSNYSCQSYIFPAGFGSVATSMSSMFQSCCSCRLHSFLAGFGVVCTNMSSMFNGNYSCQSYSFPNGFGVVATTVGDIGPISQRTTIKIQGLAYAQSFSIANSNLQVNELVEVFNALPTVPGKSLTITGNPGVPGLTAPNEAIATGKGWTLVK